MGTQHQPSRAQPRLKALTAAEGKRVRAKAICQHKAIIVGAPEPLRTTCARQALFLEARPADLESQLEELVLAAAPSLLQQPGVGVVTAAQIIVSWAHLGRLRSEAAFAASQAPLRSRPAGVRRPAPSQPFRRPAMQPGVAHHHAVPPAASPADRPTPTPRTAPARARPAGISNGASNAPSPGSWSAAGEYCPRRHARRSATPSPGPRNRSTCASDRVSTDGSSTISRNRQPSNDPSASQNCPQDSGRPSTTTRYGPPSGSQVSRPATSPPADRQPDPPGHRRPPLTTQPASI